VKSYSVSEIEAACRALEVLDALEFQLVRGGTTRESILNIICDGIAEIEAEHTRANKTEAA